MKTAGTLQITTPTDREIVMTRSFNAPRDLVWQALTQPELVRQWMLGPPGWTMPVCDMQLKVGAVNRLLWRNEQGKEMGMRNTIQEIVPPERLVVIEKFDEAWYPGEAQVTHFLTETNGVTTLVLTVRYESKEARDGVLKSDMETGVTAGYDRLEKLLATLGPAADKS